MSCGQITGKPCYRRGKGSHAHPDCPFREATCHNCGRKGHIKWVCRFATRGKPPRAKWIATDLQAPSEEEVLQVGAMPSRPYQVQLKLNGVTVTIEVDTGAAVTLVLEKVKQSLFPKAKMDPPSITLHTYTSEPIAVVGQMVVTVRYQGYKGKHKLYVVHGDGPALLRQDWLQHGCLDWKAIHSIATESSLKALLDKYEAVFQPQRRNIPSSSPLLRFVRGGPISQRGYFLLKNLLTRVTYNTEHAHNNYTSLLYIHTALYSRTSILPKVSIHYNSSQNLRIIIKIGPWPAKV